jgi:hypothetical protein
MKFITKQDHTVKQLLIPPKRKYVIDISSIGIFFNTYNGVFLVPWKQMDTSIHIFSGNGLTECVGPSSIIIHTMHTINWERIDVNDTGITVTPLKPCRRTWWRLYFLTDGSDLIIKGGNQFISSGVFVPHEWERGQDRIYRFIHPCNGDPRVLVCPQSGIIIVIFPDNTVFVYY